MLGFRGLIGWLVKRPIRELNFEYYPSPLALDVERRQTELERKLAERERRRDIVLAQVRAKRSTT